MHAVVTDEGMEEMNDSPVSISSRALSDAGPCCGIAMPTAGSEVSRSDGCVNQNSKNEVNIFLDKNSTHQSIKVPQSVVSESISPNDAVDVNCIDQVSPHKLVDDGK